MLWRLLAGLARLVAAVILAVVLYIAGIAVWVTLAPQSFDRFTGVVLALLDPGAGPQQRMVAPLPAFQGGPPDTFRH